MTGDALGVAIAITGFRIEAGALGNQLFKLSLAKRCRLAPFRRWASSTPKNIECLPLAISVMQGDLPGADATLHPAIFAASSCLRFPCIGNRKKDRKMDNNHIESLRSNVSCSALLDSAGFAVDAGESTRRAIKYRRGKGQIVIVIHDGNGWFDPLSDAKGDVFSLAMHLGAADFPSALREVGQLVGYAPVRLTWKRPLRGEPLPSIASRWSSRHPLFPHSPSWTYLTNARRLSDEVIKAAAAQDLLREGPFGSMWTKHSDATGAIQGWEERGPNWRGFSTGGRKMLFRFGSGMRFCITEAAIDALSLAALEGIRADSCYLSTGGGWSPRSVDALKALFSLPGATVLAATDDDEQGDVYAGRLEAIAGESGVPCPRLRPPHGDWNNSLKVL